jgi:hypothetical protein
MSTEVIINKWDGGHAEDLRTANLDECAYSWNFDIFTDANLLSPYPDSVAETVSGLNMSDVQIDGCEISNIAGNYVLTGAGYASAVSTVTEFYIKSSIVASYSAQATSAGTIYQKNSLTVFKDKGYAIDGNGSNTFFLYRYDSAGVVTNVGSISTTAQFSCKPFVHPEDNILYIMIGTVIAKWDGTTFSTVTTILPTGYLPASLTDYGSYLAIGVNPTRGTGSAIVYLWGRDTTLNTFQGTIDFGEGVILSIENLNNNLIALMQPQTAFLTNQVNRIIIRGYSGSDVQEIKSLNVPTTITGNPIKRKNNQKMYFGFANDTALYCVGKNKDGNYIITQDRYIFNGVAIGQSFNGLSIIGDVFWKAFQTVGNAFTLMRGRTQYLGEGFTYNATSIRRTTINPNMIAGDRFKNKQINAIGIMYTGVAGGLTKIKYSVDGSADVVFISDSQVGEIFVNNTIDIASLPVPNGREYTFQIESTGGNTIKQLIYSYDVIPDLV